MGCEFLGPLLRDDLTVAPVRYEDGHLVVPGAGLGVGVD
jgi:hypothetical protein